MDSASYQSIVENVFFGISLTVISYWVGTLIHKKTKLILLNPLLVAVAIVILFLTFMNIKFDTYYFGASYFQMLITPATVAMAVPLYRQISVLKTHFIAVLVSIFSGCTACFITIFSLSKLFHISPEIYYGLLPKSVTLAIALGINDELGGVSSITCVGVVVSGILGAAIATLMSKAFKIKDNVAFGIAMGTSAHAVGTSKAIEINELSGAMGSLAIIVAGVINVIFAPLFAMLY